jgi:hypothetical protein
MYYESTEKVTDRRLGMNGRNRSFYTTLVVAIAVAFNWAVANPQYLYVALAATALISLVAIVFSVYWSAQVQDLKRLNAAKFQTLAQMAPHVVMDSPHHPQMILFDTFTREWELLEKSGGLKQRTRIGVKALKASGAEMFEIYAVRTIFLLFSAISVIVLVVNWSQVLHNWQALLGL